MIFEKCPRCDLNYITPSEKYCKVCMREMKGDNAHDEIEMCSVCSENPVLPGRDICLFCLKEMSGSGSTDGDVEENQAVVDESTIGLNSMSNMDEIIPQIHEDIPDNEFGDIEDELSLESVIEEEENEADDQDDED